MTPAPLRLADSDLRAAWGRYSGAPYAGAGSGLRAVVVGTNGLAPKSLVQRPGEVLATVCCTCAASVVDLAAGPRSWPAGAWADSQIEDPARRWSPLELLSHETGNPILEGDALRAAAQSGWWQLQGWTADWHEGHSMHWHGLRSLVVASGWPTGRVGSEVMSWTRLVQRWPQLRGVRLDGPC